MSATLPLTNLRPFESLATDLTAVPVAAVSRRDTYGRTLPERLIDLHARAAGAIQPLGIATLPEGPVLVDNGSRGTDWVFLGLEDDPQYQAGALAIPRRVRRDLRRLDARGVTFDRLLIGHELPAGTAAAADATVDPVGLIEEAPTSPVAERKRDGLVTAARFIATSARGAARAAAATVGGAASVAALALDPALLGLISPSGRAHPGEPVAVFLVAQW